MSGITPASPDHRFVRLVRPALVAGITIACLLLGGCAGKRETPASTASTSPAADQSDAEPPTPGVRPLTVEQEEAVKGVK